MLRSRFNLKMLLKGWEIMHKLICFHRKLLISMTGGIQTIANTILSTTDKKISRKKTISAKQIYWPKQWEFLSFIRKFIQDLYNLDGKCLSYEQFLEMNIKTNFIEYCGIKKAVTSRTKHIASFDKVFGPHNSSSLRIFLKNEKGCNDMYQ